MSYRIRPGDLSDPRVLRLIELHHGHAHANAPADSVFALDPSALAAPGVEFRVLWEGDRALACGALKRLSDRSGELKSMHVAEAARGRGLGRVMLAHLEDRARALGLAVLYLETGSMAAYAPARALYAACGYAECGRFGAYPVDPNSVYMTKTLG